ARSASLVRAPPAGATRVGSTCVGSTRVGSAKRTGILLELAQGPLQPLQSVAHAALHGVLSDPGDLGDFLKGHVADVTEQEHLPLFLGELVDGEEDLLPDFVGHRNPLGAARWLRVRHLLSRGSVVDAVALIEGRMTSMLLATELIHAQVASNRVEPGRESGFVLELAGSLHEAQERVLSDVLGPRGMPQVAQGEVVDGSLVTTQELGERFAIASLIADHENLV